MRHFHRCFKNKDLGTARTANEMKMLVEALMAAPHETRTAMSFRDRPEKTFFIRSSMPAHIVHEVVFQAVGQVNDPSLKRITIQRESLLLPDVFKSCEAPCEELEGLAE